MCRCLHVFVDGLINSSIAVGVVVMLLLAGLVSVSLIYKRKRELRRKRKKVYVMTSNSTDVSALTDNLNTRFP